MFGNPCFCSCFLNFDPKTGFFGPKTGNYFRTFFRTIFAKFLRIQKDQIFPKNFRTSKTELFRNLRKQKVWKIPSNAGPYLKLSPIKQDSRESYRKHFNPFESLVCLFSIKNMNLIVLTKCPNPSRSLKRVSNLIFGNSCQIGFLESYQTSPNNLFRPRNLQALNFDVH